MGQCSGLTWLRKRWEVSDPGPDRVGGTERSTFSVPHELLDVVPARFVPGQRNFLRLFRIPFRGSRQR